MCTFILLLRSHSYTNVHTGTREETKPNLIYEILYLKSFCVYCPTAFQFGGCTNYSQLFICLRKNVLTNLVDNFDYTFLRSVGVSFFFLKGWYLCAHALIITFKHYTNQNIYNWCARRCFLFMLLRYIYINTYVPFATV